MLSMSIPSLADLQNSIASADKKKGDGIFGSWQFLEHSDTGKPICTFTSFYNLEYDADSKTTTYPIEGGSFFTANKQSNPYNCTVTLIKDGINLPFQKQQFLDALNKYLREPLTVDIITPSAAYLNCSIESLSYKQNPDAGADLLFVTMKIRQIKELAPLTTATVAIATKEPNSASTVERGLTVAQNIILWIQGLFK